MTTQTKDGWKRALFILVFVVMAAVVFALTAIAPLSFIRSSPDNNIESLMDELGACQSFARKMWIIQQLGALNEPSTTGALQEYLGYRHPAVRAAAISAIAKIRGLPVWQPNIRIQPCGTWQNGHA
jgi:HEAT repeat protein